MKKRSVSLVLMAILVSGIAALVAPGCSRSVMGECRRVCVATCETGDDCEDYLPGQVDREDCIRDCDESCEDFEDDVFDECDDGVEIRGDVVDRCVNAIHHLGDVCREDDESELAEAVGDMADECGEEAYRCRR